MAYYGSVEGLFEYLANMGYPLADFAPSPSPAEGAEAALRRGSLYIDGAYRARFPGRKVNGRAQSLEWPRTDAEDNNGDPIPDDEIPDEVIRATYEAAYREALNPGSLAPDYVASERVKSESVGPLSVTYMDSRTTGSEAAQESWPVIGIIDFILAPLLGTVASNLFGQVSR